MEIILLERVEKVGNMGDVVRVKDGYARNYLLPRRKALRATADNREHFEARRTELEQSNAERRTDAEKSAGTLDGQICVLLRQASDSGQLYGSVTARDVAGVASQSGVAVDRRQVQLARTIKTLGVHTVRIFLHPEVPSIVQIIVARSDAEAEAQKQMLAGGGTEAESGAAPADAGADAVQLGAEAFFEEGAGPRGEDEDEPGDGEPAESPGAEGHTRA